MRSNAEVVWKCFKNREVKCAPKGEGVALHFRAPLPFSLRGDEVHRRPPSPA